MEDICARWAESPLNIDNCPLAPRTFHNHRDYLEQVFGITILCNRSTNTYYIDPAQRHDANLKIWMLQTLATGRITSPDTPWSRHMLIEEVPEEKIVIIPIFEAIVTNKLLRVILRHPALYDGRSEVVIAPYCLRFHHNSWYMLGRDADSNEMKAYDLAMIREAVVTGRSFILPSSFSPASYFQRFFGAEIVDGAPTVNVQLKVTGRTSERLRVMPLHVSQHEIESGDDYSVFEYTLVPTDDFIHAILAMGKTAEVLSPQTLRDRFGLLIAEMSSKYNH